MNSKENGPINFGYPDDISIKELALLIKKSKSFSGLINKEPLTDDPIKRVFEIKKAEKLLNWFKNTSFRWYRLHN